VRQRQDRRTQPGGDRSVAERNLRVTGRGAVTVGDGGQLALWIAHCTRLGAQGSPKHKKPPTP
jgi:hypothetical protein